MADNPQATTIDVAAYNATRHWGLPLYNDVTTMDMRDGYNHAMCMIDQILTQLQTEIREKD